jgi:hypothetical protein
MRCLALAFFALAALGAVPVAAGQSSKIEFMALEDVRPGMKGYGLAVFEGSEPERFEVEVLGVLRGVQSPKQNAVIARLGGPRVTRTNVFAGMSGSPVYIDGKLLGAVAFTYAFVKEPLAGITPIREMIENFRANEPRERQAKRPVSFSELISSGASSPNNDRLVAPGSSGLIPIATPVSFSGIPQSIIDMFSDELKRLGIHPVIGASGSGSASGLSPLAPANEATLTPGKSLSVQLVRGDFTIDASGTVTHRDGDRIYAFGHTFLQSGSASWPMAEASVITVVPNLNSSFKLSNSGKLVGTVSQDRATGVYGVLGEKPVMIPARVTVHTSRNQTRNYQFEIVSDPLLTPLLLRFAALGAVSATERVIGTQTIILSGHIKVDGHPDVVLGNTFSMTNGAPVMAVNSVERPLAILLNSGFDPVKIREIVIDMTSSDIKSGGSLSRLWIDKSDVGRGETIEVQAFARRDNGDEFVQRIPLEIPADAPLGPLTILVGDGTSLSQMELRTAADFVPKDLGQLVRAMNKLKRNNRLYLKVLRSSSGAIVNNEEMPSLPPSVLATLGSQRTSGGYVPISTATIAEQELPPSEFIISGQQAITISVVK